MIFSTKYLLTTIALGGVVSSLPAAPAASSTNTATIFDTSDDCTCNKKFYTSGSCGFSQYRTQEFSKSEKPFIALGGNFMDKAGSSQSNSYCGATVRLTANGKSVEVIVADTKKAGGYDLCTDTFKKLGGDLSQQSIDNVSWEKVSDAKGQLSKDPDTNGNSAYQCPSGSDTGSSAGASSAPDVDATSSVPNVSSPAVPGETPAVPGA